MKPGAFLLVMSSIPVDSAREQAEAAKAHGVAYVDAPVSGGEKGATEGTLAIMAGGEQRDVDALRPLLNASAASPMSVRWAAVHWPSWPTS